MVLTFIYQADLLTVTAQVTGRMPIVHQCNCVTTGDGKGLYTSIIRKYKYAHIYKEDICRKPGKIVVRGSKGQRYVVAFLSQNFPGRPRNQTDTQKMRLEWFKKCLRRLGKVGNLKSVAFPYGIGCGLAKGNWQEYEKAIVEWSRTVNIKIVIVCQGSAYSG